MAARQTVRLSGGQGRALPDTGGFSCSRRVCARSALGEKSKKRCIASNGSPTPTGPTPLDTNLTSGRLEGAGSVLICASAQAYAQQDGANCHRERHLPLDFAELEPSNRSLAGPGCFRADLSAAVLAGLGRADAIAAGPPAHSTPAQTQRLPGCEACETLTRNLPQLFTRKRRHSMAFG